MKRVLGIVLFGLGVLCAVFAVGLRVYVTPTVTKLPYDLGETTSTVEAKNATFLQGSEEEGFVLHRNKDLRSVTFVKPQPKLTEELQPLFKDKAVVWDVYTITRRVDDESKVAESATEIALDRVSGAAFDWADAWYSDQAGVKTKVKFAGHIYKMPFYTEKKDYPFWDGHMGAQAPPAKFEAVETIGGLEVYRFTQTIPWLKTQTRDDARSVFLSNFAKEATTGDIWYRNTRTLWVEPVTGQFLKVREQRQLEFRDDLGGTTPILDGDFVYTEATIDESVKRAVDNRALLMAVSVYAPLGLGALGLILIIVGSIVAGRRPAEAIEPRHSYDG